MGVVDEGKLHVTIPPFCLPGLLGLQPLRLETQPPGSRAGIRESVVGVLGVVEVRSDDAEVAGVWAEVVKDRADRVPKLIVVPGAGSRKGGETSRRDGRT